MAAEEWDLEPEFFRPAIWITSLDTFIKCLKQNTMIKQCEAIFYAKVKLHVYFMIYQYSDII